MENSRVELYGVVRARVVWVDVVVFVRPLHVKLDFYLSPQLPRRGPALEGEELAHEGTHVIAWR
jgi:hypothetical protein